MAKPPAKQELEIVSPRYDSPESGGNRVALQFNPDDPYGEPKVTPVEIVSQRYDSSEKRVSWKKATELQQEIRDSAIRGITAQILLGMELQNIKAKLGETRGGAETGSFEELVKEKLGLSKMTAWRYIQLADGAQTHCKELATLRNTGASVEKLLPLLSAATEGKTQKDLLLEWGLITESPTPALPDAPKIGGKTAGSVGRPSVTEDTLVQETISTWEGLVHSLDAEINLTSYHRLPDGVLSDALTVLATARETLEAALRERKAAPEAEPTKPKERKAKVKVVDADAALSALDF